jgi:serine protease Do
MQTQPMKVFAPADGLFAATSAEATTLVERTRPSVVQVRSAGRGNGTGVIWRADGAIITNDHVIAETGGQVEVLLSDGRRFTAQVVNRAPHLDLALLKIDATDLPAARVANSEAVRVGELVFAIGHPWGQPWVTTAGIISGLGELSAPDGRKAPYLRSDVRLAPGNSGGPLLNASGEVIGINAMVFGGDLSVAIPSHVAARWAGAWSAGRQPVRLGVGLQAVELPTAIRQGAWANQQTGLIVVGVDPASLAAKALLIGDLLIEADGIGLSDPAALRDALMRNDTHTLSVYLLRAGAVIAVDIGLTDVL